MTSLCTDVPPHSEKKSREETLFSPFFFSEGGGGVFTQATTQLENKASRTARNFQLID